LLIRSGKNLVTQSTTARKLKQCAPDVVHLRSKRKGNFEPVISGTSLSGVLRHRAERIVNTFNKNIQIIHNLFGFVEGKRAQASRLIVQESVIENTAEIVQNRIAIDRFTGGAYHGALFNEQPIFGVEKIEEQKKTKKDKKNLSKNNDSKHFELKLELHKPKEEQYEIGLLLLLLKDLWTGDLPIGGTTSIGRGRLQGLEATITWEQPNKPIKKWVISQNKEKLKVDENTKKQLEEFVQAFINKAP
jgi:CRISPR/Cas system CSM-associated protein Csm3 (group 7 of RAMP superfamily)